ncbi:accessory factor UbiK family protein [Streptomyces sp. S1A1-8]|nr:accessory factor UbiK family protein [Streptomyces sp. S1D4-20]QDN65562.1 accessory factor UbiK family protein [Streptomyces sp. S1D4-14]QDN96205.1 accessory factor UbiK family protein [Streptomyces sp. RLB1-9]QDO17913.1 accessory factor UbiK family protein [Streptomyces sp. S1A1-8]QDO28040.1 accessory factor UbiK family protein [Streptomyces sp. S1A1-3]QDO47968.1 accessory factor UbiK family protein [Streptomyces sp. RLB3-5]QDO58209.1 accessory factor UbiK family protein [Streptomyces sp.
MPKPVDLAHKLERALERIEELEARVERLERCSAAVAAAPPPRRTHPSAPYQSTPAGTNTCGPVCPGLTPHPRSTS